MTKYQTNCIETWREKGLRYISDILYDEGKILTSQQVKQIYHIGGSYLDYMGLINSLPREWKSIPMKNRAEYPTIHPQVAFVMSKEKGAKYLYNVLLRKKIEGVKNTWESGWEIRYGEINWVEIYQSMYHNSSVYHHILRYKVITYYTNCCNK